MGKAGARTPPALDALFRVAELIGEGFGEERRERTIAKEMVAIGAIAHKAAVAIEQVEAQFIVWQVIFAVEQIAKGAGKPREGEEQRLH